MKHIQNIDEACKHQTRVDNPAGKEKYRNVISKPKEAYGLLKYKIRLIKAIAVLRGKADAFTYSAQFYG